MKYIATVVFALPGGLHAAGLLPNLEQLPHCRSYQHHKGCALITLNYCPDLLILSPELEQLSTSTMGVHYEQIRSNKYGQMTVKPCYSL
jgi:hypothetical protein